MRVPLATSSSLDPPTTAQRRPGPGCSAFPTVATKGTSPLPSRRRLGSPTAIAGPVTPDGPRAYAPGCGPPSKCWVRSRPAEGPRARPRQHPAYLTPCRRGLRLRRRPPLPPFPLPPPPSSPPPPPPVCCRAHPGHGLTGGFSGAREPMTRPPPPTHTPTLTNTLGVVTTILVPQCPRLSPRPVLPTAPPSSRSWPHSPVNPSPGLRPRSPPPATSSFSWRMLCHPSALPGARPCTTAQPPPGRYHRELGTGGHIPCGPHAPLHRRHEPGVHHGHCPARHGSSHPRQGLAELVHRPHLGRHPCGAWPHPTHASPCPPGG